MPIYVYLHPVTGEEIEVLVSFTDIDVPYKAPDGTKCIRVQFPSSIAGKTGVIDKNAEVWEKDPSYVKKLAPKFVKRRDGVKEKYDPNRHC